MYSWYVNVRLHEIYSFEYINHGLRKELCSLDVVAFLCYDQFLYNIMAFLDPENDWNFIKFIYKIRSKSDWNNNIKNSKYKKLFLVT